ncbi:MAG: ATP-dependent helicase pcrA [Chlamydiota bacterium]|jgi:DNA helicase-2/ATP-dependent DNA helicase PcrA
MVQLNPQQQAAVSHIDGPLLVLAGAGSGKTRVVTERVGALIDRGVLPSEILAVTFTNKAAGEMRHRIHLAKGARVLACTFHSLGARILRESIYHLGYKSDFVIYDEEDSEKLLRTCLEELSDGVEKKDLKTVRHQITEAKNDLVEPADAEGDLLFIKAYRLYQERLKSSNAVDFDDLLSLVVHLFRKAPEALAMYQTRWRYVLIDEYQDTNEAQYTIAKLLVAKHGNLFAVGDPDQSIYSWRGARYQNILHFERDFPGAKVIALDQNYRSTNTILKAANALICNNEKRYEKALWSDLGPGAKVGLFRAQTERQEAEWVALKVLHALNRGQVPPEEVAIFYRTHAQSRPFEDALLMHRIPYKIIGGISFYERREVKDMLAYLRMILFDADLIAFMRTIATPKRGIGAASIKEWAQIAIEREMPIFTLCCDHLGSITKLTTRQKNGLQEYTRLIHKLRHLRASLKVHELIRETIIESNYLKYLEEDPESAQERKENLEELVGKAAEWEEEQTEPSLALFLEELSLRSQMSVQTDLPSVQLMTLHNSKGLEFHTVFLTGLEEDLFPHVNAKETPDGIAEERRLCYVGMTRAKRELYLTTSLYRYMWGTPRVMRPSRFLGELPPEYIQPIR